MENFYVEIFENIVINSLNLNERINLLRSNQWKKQDSPLLLTSFLEETWRNNFLGLPLNVFEKRLKWSTINKGDLENLSSIQPLKFELPKWAEVGQLIVYYFENNAVYHPVEKLDFSEDLQINIPFLEIFSVLSDWGMSQLLSNNIHLEITDFAIANLKIDLVLKLSDLLTTILYEEFKSESYLVNQLDSGYCINNSSIIKRKLFFDWLKAGGMLNIFSSYPVIARLIGELFIKWEKEYLKLFDRLLEDSSEIYKVFAIDIRKNSLNKIHSSLSDSHNGGQSVKHLQFSCGKSIIYKPKNIEIDKAFYEFSNWFKNISGSKSLKPLKTVCLRDHGWVEYLEYKPIKDQNTLNQYYFNAGTFLCLAHILKITDCHYENLISNNKNLTLIDCETVMHPQVLLADDFASNKLLNQSFLQSIFRTGLLPSWSSHLNNKSVLDISGFGGLRHSNPSQINYIWKDSQFDSVEFLQCEKDNIFQSKNQPLNKSFSVSLYLDAIQEGFKQAYYILLKNRHILLDKRYNPLTQFYNKQTRYIYRATEVYDKVLKYALAPKNLKHGLLFSVALDILSRAHMIEENKTDLWNIYLHEFDQIHCLDIPIFYSNTSSSSVNIGYGFSFPFFEKSGYELSCETIRNLSDEDLLYQLNILHGALFASKIEPPHIINPESHTKEGKDLKIYNNNNVDFLGAAEKIGEELILRRNNGNDYNWLSISLNAKSGRYQFGTLGYNLFDGLSGIALFFAALNKATNNTTYKQYAKQTISSVMLAFESQNKNEIEKIIQYMGLGIAEGVGSIIYSLINISEYINDPQILESALNISNSLNEQVIFDDKQHDIVSGSAGLILALIKLYRLTNNTHISYLLNMCGRHLLKSLNHKLDYFFESKINNPMTGFSHGAAGISYAMFKLYELTGDDSYKTLAMKYLLYEKSQLNRVKFSYPDFRYELNQKSPNAWCHGVAGIFLSRVAVLKHIRELEEEYSEIENGLTHLLSTQNYGADHLCCGNAGRIDILLSAGILLEKQSLIQEATIRMRQLVSKVIENGGYQLNSTIPKNYSNLGIFQGISGIGYQLLRINDPQVYKSILLFE